MRSARKYLTITVFFIVAYCIGDMVDFPFHSSLLRDGYVSTHRPAATQTARSTEMDSLCALLSENGRLADQTLLCGAVLRTSLVRLQELCGLTAQLSGMIQGMEPHASDLAGFSDFVSGALGALDLSEASVMQAAGGGHPDMAQTGNNFLASYFILENRIGSADAVMREIASLKTSDTASEGRVAALTALWALCRADMSALSGDMTSLSRWASEFSSAASADGFTEALSQGTAMLSDGYPALASDAKAILASLSQGIPYISDARDRRHAVCGAVARCLTEHGVEQFRAQTAGADTLPLTELALVSAQEAPASTPDLNAVSMDFSAAGPQTVSILTDTILRDGLVTAAVPASQYVSY